MGEGKVDYSLKNDNDVVNPKEAGWKWERVQDKLNELFSEL